MGQPQILPFTKEELIFDYVEKGMLQKEIAAKYHTTQKVVWRAMKNLKVQTRPCNSWAFHNQIGEQNNQWKGDKASYFTLHQRLRRHKGTPNKCEICGIDDPTKTYHWANLSGKYDDFADYKRMCVPCHRKYDKAIRNIKHMREKIVNGI